MEGVATSPAVDLGTLVEHPSARGIGRIGDRDGGLVRVDWFESVAVPVAASRWVDGDKCHRVRLLAQTRVYCLDPDTGMWRTGRVVGGGPHRYFVRFPNTDIDAVVSERELRVRWERPIADPIDVMLAGANESAHFRDARLPMLRSLVAQRAACGSVEALLSSAIEIYPHQVHAAMTILSDPVQRYLLADEVGLGKTVEAGIVIRQVLLDRPDSQIVVVAPEVLRRQWRRELLEKFFIDDFPKATVKITAHETPDRWGEYHGFDLAVVDEAHQLARVTGSHQTPYRELRALAHSTRRLLLMSATPFTTSLATTLGLLHLLDPTLYGWDRWDEFQSRFDVRKKLATAVYALDADFEPLLRDAIKDIAELLPEDPEFARLASEVSVLLTEEGDLADEADRRDLVSRVAALRAHVSETYRLHRRIVRHRRTDVLRDITDDTDTVPFEVTGRRPPQIVALDIDQAHVIDDALLRWQSHVAAWVLDCAEEGHTEDFGMALGVLVSRADWVSSDLADALRWRLFQDSHAAERAGLTREERQLLTTPPVVPGEQDVVETVLDTPSNPDTASVSRVLRQVAGRHERIVVFCGAGSLVDQLVQQFEVLADGETMFVHTRRTDASECEQAVRDWRARGGVLLADDTAEDGLNLQAADAVVHCRIPWSPNRLEQRVGRVDRYESPLGTRRPPAAQYVLLGQVDGLVGAWLDLLTTGVDIFGGSVSSLQDALDRGLPAWWSAAAINGPEGLADMRGQVRDALVEERKHVHAMDILESVHESAPSRHVATRIGRLEMCWPNLRDALLGYAGQQAGGLRFADRGLDSQRRVVRFERGSVDPLMPPRMFANATQPLRPDVMTASFNRTVALRNPSTRLFRAGNPFVDTLARVAAIDDRGQATAFCRRSGGPHGEHEVFFGFDYLVEADIAEALHMLDDVTEAQLAVRRQADRLLTPFIRRVWLPAGSQRAVSERALRDWLDRPYDPRRGDVNLNASRIDVLLDLFDGYSGFGDALRASDAAGREELARLTDLSARQEHALAEGRRTLAVHRAQSRARQAAGGLVADTEGLLVNVEVSEALLAGVARPVIRAVSVTCMVCGLPARGLDDGG